MRSKEELDNVIDDLGNMDWISTWISVWRDTHNQCCILVFLFGIK